MQLLYGDDGLDPVSMEGKDGTPVDLRRLFMRVRRARCFVAAGCLMRLLQICAELPRLSAGCVVDTSDPVGSISATVARNRHVRPAARVVARSGYKLVCACRFHVVTTQASPTFSRTA